MARHRRPDGAAPRRTGASGLILIFTIAALVVFTTGLVWAVIGPSKVPLVPGSLALEDPGSPSARPAGASSMPPAVGSSVQPAPVTSAVPSATTSRPASPRSVAHPRRPSPRPASPTPAGALVVRAFPDSWPGVYSAGYTITNGTRGDVDNWTVVVTFNAPVTIVNAWRVRSDVRGATVTLDSLPYDSRISPGGSQTFGLQVRGRDRTPVPVSCTVNGHPCAGS